MDVPAVIANAHIEDVQGSVEIKGRNWVIYTLSHWDDSAIDPGLQCLTLRTDH